MVEKQEILIIVFIYHTLFTGESRGQKSHRGIEK